MSDPKMPVFEPVEVAELVERPVLAIPDPDLDRLESEVVVAYQRGVPAPTWVIGSLGHAERAMRRLKAAREGIAALGAARAEFQEEVERAFQDAIAPFCAARVAALEPIGDWYAGAVGPLKSTAEFFEGQLERYALERREADPKHAKSLPLPSGRVGTTAGRTSTDITDEEQLLDSIESILPANLAEACIRRHVSKTDLLAICSVHRVQLLRCVDPDGAPWEVARFDTDYEVGSLVEVPRPGASGVPLLVTVVEVLEDAHRVCYRADADVDEDGQESGGTLHVLEGIKVTVGEVTAKVVVGG